MRSKMCERVGDLLMKLLKDRSYVVRHNRNGYLMEIREQKPSSVYVKLVRSTNPQYMGRLIFIVYIVYVKKDWIGRKVLLNNEDQNWIANMFRVFGLPAKIIYPYAQIGVPTYLNDPFGVLKDSHIEMGTAVMSKRGRKKMFNLSFLINLYTTYTHVESV